MTDQLTQAYERILASVHPYPLPDPATPFEPGVASNMQLALYGLPERPAPEDGSEPGLFWQEMMGPGTVIIAPEFPDAASLRATDQPATVREARATSGPGRQYVHRRNSRNWSGAAITPLPRPNLFMQVIGAWTVPSGELPAVPPAGAEAGSEYRASDWIGIGGQRSYNSLPQIGTSVHVRRVGSSLQVEHEAWWQWWIKDRPGHNKPMPIRNFEVRAGDVILASLTVEAPGDVRFNIKNQRTHKLAAFKVRAPAGIHPLGTTAEWVHERPTHMGAMYPLPRCSEVTFRYCLAWSAPQLGARPVPQRLSSNARYIRMVEAFDAPRRSALVSVPEPVDATTVKVRYQEGRLGSENTGV